MGSCERTVCPNDCSGRGICYTQKQLASEAGKTYTSPWDAMKHVGCVCDLGYRGPDCSLRSAHRDLMCSLATVTRRDVTAPAEVSATTPAVFASASLATSAPSASTRPSSDKFSPSRREQRPKKEEGVCRPFFHEITQAINTLYIFHIEEKKKEARSSERCFPRF